MEIEVVADKLIELISGVKGASRDAFESVSSDDDFITQFGFDSMESVKLTFEIGQVFGFDFGEDIEDIDSLVTFGGLVEQIQRRTAVAG